MYIQTTLVKRQFVKEVVLLHKYHKGHAIKQTSLRQADRMHFAYTYDKCYNQTEVCSDRQKKQFREELTKRAINGASR